MGWTPPFNLKPEERKCVFCKKDLSAQESLEMIPDGEGRYSPVCKNCGDEFMGHLIEGAEDNVRGLKDLQGKRDNR